MKKLLFSVIALLFIAPKAYSLDLTGTIINEYRFFPYKAVDEKNFHSNYSIALQPQLHHAWDNDYSSVTFTPFFREDQNDQDGRTHFDIREANYKLISGDWEYLIGVSRVTWGVGASFHIVDVISQLDFVDHPVWQPKQGQQMINIKRKFGDHSLELFVLPGSRQRTFSGKDGRLRLTPRVDTSQTQYESSDGNRHVDEAVHYYYKTENVNGGIYQFWGTSRDPSFTSGKTGSGESVLVPYYPIINQVGSHLQATSSNFTVRSELLNRWGQNKRFFASINGGDYMMKQIGGSKYDLDFLIEYHYSDKAGAVNTPFENDLFAGVMFYFNDERKTWIGAGDVIDMNSPSQSIVFLLQSDLSKKWKLAAEYRGLINTLDTEGLYSIRRDGFYQVELIYNL